MLAAPGSKAGRAGFPTQRDSVATSTQAQGSKATAPQGTGAGGFALPAAPLLALTQDAKFLATLKSVTDAKHPVLAAGSEIDLSSALMGRHAAGVAVLDAAAVATPIAKLTARLHAQFPDLVLIVAGNADEQGALAAQITDGSVHRFLHKPVSEQRVRLFVEAAWRRHEEALHGRSTAAGAAPRPPRRVKWGLLAAGAVVLGAALGWYAIRPHEEPAAPPAEPAATTAAQAADDAVLEELLVRAGTALAAGALVAPPEANAADLYREALRRNARDPRAANGLEQVIDRLVTDAEAQLQDHHLDAAQQLADQARAISPNHARVAFLTAQIGAQRERAVLGKAQRAAASGDVSAALAVIDDAAKGGPRSTLVDQARQQLAQKQVDERVADLLLRGREALASGAVIEPPQENARFLFESARTLAPADPAVQQAHQELIARLQGEAHQAIAAGNAEQADAWINAAAESGAAAAEVAALHTAAQQLRGAAKADALAHTEALFNQRMAQGRLLEPANDSARYYLEQLAQAEPANASTLAARTAFETRLLGEAHNAVQAHDYAAGRHWLSEAQAAGASPVAVAAAESELAAAQAAAPSAARATAEAATSYVNASVLTRTRYVAPQFPANARDRRLEGWVDVQFVVKTDGALGDVSIVGAEPVGVFEQVALDAVRRWRYQPVMRDGQAIAQRARIRVRFAMQP